MGRFRHGNSFYDDNRYEDGFNKAMRMGILYSSGLAIFWTLLEVYASFLSFLCPVSLGYIFCYGFIRFGGRFEKRIETFLVGYIILLSLFISYVSTCISLYLQNDVTLFYALTSLVPELLANNEGFRNTFLSNISISFIFALLGAWYTIYSIRRGSFSRR